MVAVSVTNIFLLQLDMLATPFRQQGNQLSHSSPAESIHQHPNLLLFFEYSCILNPFKIR